MYGVKNS